MQYGQYFKGKTEEILLRLTTIYFQVHLPLAKTPFDVSLLNDYEEAVRKNGVVVLKNVFSKEHLDELTHEFDKNWQEVEKRLRQ